HAVECPRYPCTHCKRHRGADGFKRKDHLTQHLRNYHHIEADGEGTSGYSCSHEDCAAFRSSPGGLHSPHLHAFQKKSDYTAHMKKEHDESPHPCSWPGCNRVRGKGFFRERDLMKHEKK
ncbi:hypothetical protein BJ546DRAFT_803693, partial [Cryomyces antarcticus]